MPEETQSPRSAEEWRLEGMGGWLPDKDEARLLRIRRDAVGATGRAERRQIFPDAEPQTQTLAPSFEEHGFARNSDERLEDSLIGPDAAAAAAAITAAKAGKGKRHEFVAVKENRRDVLENVAPIGVPLKAKDKQEDQGNREGREGESKVKTPGRPPLPEQELVPVPELAPPQEEENDSEWGPSFIWPGSTKKKKDNSASRYTALLKARRYEPEASTSVNVSLIPSGAITTPPDSSDDDERSPNIGDLHELQMALQHIDQKRIPSRETFFDREVAALSQLPLETASKFPEQQATSEDHQDDASTTSTVSNSLDSVFSAYSSGTAATALSKESGFSREQIRTATRVFVSIIQSDQVLGPLYENARNDPSLGANKLRRHVRAALKTYADDLKGEARDHLEFSASQLVYVQAGHAARCIVTDSKSTHHSTKDADDSSDDETQERPVDERQFDDDLEAFGSFLIQSNAFAKLRAQTALFCSPQPTTSVVNDNVEEPVQIHSGIVTPRAHAIHLFKEAVVCTMVNVLVSLECLEPPIEAGWTRIKVECHTCGERFFDDVPEQHDGSISRLKQRMERTLKATITVVHSGEGDASSGGHWHLPPLIHNARRGITKTIQWIKSLRPPILPFTNQPGVKDDPGSSDIVLENVPKLWIMSCVHRNWEHTILLQDPVGHIETDRAFFAALKAQVQRRRRRARRVLSCRSIKAIHFVKFKLRKGGMLEVRDHIACCRTTCSCMPPNNSHYDFDPPSTINDWPIVVPKTLAHILKDPDILHEDQKDISSSIPKRKKEELTVAPNEQSVEGWGLYFEEGWEKHDIIALVVIAFIASLLFLILWSVYTSDVSSASGVASFMVGAFVMFSGLAVTRTGTMA